MNNFNISRVNKYKSATVMIHSASPSLSINQIAYWIEVFVRSNVNFSILLRDEKSYVQLIKLYPKYSILYALSPVDVEMVLKAQPDLNTIFYLTNLAKNIHLLRFNHLKHIFIGTKNSDQLSTVNKSYRAYDEIYVSSQSQIDKFESSIENLGHLKFSIIGKPQIKDILLRTLDVKESSNILFLPSEKQNNILSIITSLLFKSKGYGNTILSKNIKKYQKDIKSISIDYSLTIHINNDISLLSQFAINSDLIVSDIDSLSVYLLSYNIPILIYLPEENIVCVESVIPLDCLYIFSNAEEFSVLIEKLKKEDILKEKRKNITEYFLGKKETLNDEFYKKIRVDIL